MLGCAVLLGGDILCLCALMFALHTLCLQIIIEEGAQSIQQASVAFL